MAFNYNINVTGDCSSNQSGSFDLSISGFTPPYTIKIISPYVTEPVTVNSSYSQTGLGSGTYVLSVNDSTLPTNYQENINIPISDGVCCSVLGVNNTTCNGFDGSVTGTSTSDYSSTSFSLYNSTNTFINSGVTNTSTIVFGSLSADTYYLTALDLGGCSGRSQNFIVESSPSLNYGLYTVPNSSCGGTPIGKVIITGITGSSPFTYLWNNGQTGSTITGLTEGIYSVSVTDSYGCSLTKDSTVTKVSPIGFGLFTSTPPSCFSNDGVLNLTITGGTSPYYYSASTGDVLISYSKTFSISGLSNGSYSFQVTDAGLCQTFATTTLVSPSGIQSVNINGVNSTCSSSNGQITISVVGGASPFTYTLISPNGNTTNVSTNQTTQIYTNLSSGTYSVAVMDSSGCAYMDEVTIITENKYTISTQVTGTTCGQSNGSVTITTTPGATFPIDYSIDNGVYDIIDTTLTSVTFNNLTAGNHSITVSDANDCIQTTDISILGSTPLDFSLYTTSCGTGSSGKITAFINQGKPPFNFNWSSNVPNNPQQIQVSGLTGGTYSLILVSSDGCSLSRTTTISCNQSLTSYQTYVMGSEIFNIVSPTKLGLLQMLNEGFYDLTEGRTGCVLNSAIFTAKVSVSPLGLTTSETFYTSTSLVNPPSDNLYYDSITQLLLTVPGVGSVTVNPTENIITIETAKGNTTLEGQEIVIDLIIVYNIICLT
jgi:uncharacterized protein (DUF2141 family)